MLRKDEIMNKLKNKNPKGKLLTYQQMAEDSNLGIHTVVKLAKEAGAIIKIGRTVRVDRDVFYDYTTSVYRAD